MSGKTDYAQNKINDAVWRGQALGAPANFYFALICATKGQLARSTAYALNDTVVIQVSGKYVLYACTTAGSSAAAAPAYTGARGETITDGTAVFTEQSNTLDAGVYTEVSSAGTGYARVQVAASLANFAGTQGAGTNVASTGTNGTTSNNNVIAFPAPTAQWHPANGQIVGIVAFDAANAGNAWEWAMLSAPKSINQGDQAPSIAAGAFTSQLGA